MIVFPKYYDRAIFSSPLSLNNLKYFAEIV